MISREGDYYVCEGENQPQVEQPVAPPAQEREYEARGDIKERLTLIKNRVQELKKQKEHLANTKSSASLAQIYSEPYEEPSDFSLTLVIPQQILEIEQRVSSLEEKILGYEIHRQRSQKKGTVAERIKTLQKKLQDMLKAKSIETITNSIIQYSTNLDEREEYMKQLFLYEVYTKTHGLTEQLTVLERYLQNLSKVQRVVNSTVPTTTLIKNHNEILQRSEAMRSRIEKMFSSMKTQYKQLIQQIDGIEV